MKIRSGFVSNSSSSSYVVVFEHLPSSKEELQKMMFGDQQYYYSPYFTERKWETSMVAETVWDLIQDSAPNDLPNLEHGFDNWDDTEQLQDPYNKYPNLYSMPNDERHRILDEYYSELDRLKMEHFREFMDKNKDSYVFRFEFSDNDGEYQSDLEHGDLFDNLPHIKCSHH